MEMKNLAVRGIIFDMDNTLLRSKIDFQAMKNELSRYFSSLGLLPEHVLLEKYTASTLMEEANRTNRMTDQQKAEMWEICKRHEQIGMKGAMLEPGVAELLETLYGKYVLTVVTNNSLDAAESALRENGVASYFDCVVGRELMKSLKPSPDGVHYILNRYPHISASGWIAVGDSWIDGKAAAEAGVKFISYRGDLKTMNKNGVYPIANLKAIGDLLQTIKEI
jgi:phosphoglycolate phosphatase